MVVAAVVTAVVEVAVAPVFGNLAGLLVARRAAVAIGSSRVVMEERFFYHNFPRRGAAHKMLIDVFNPGT